MLTLIQKLAHLCLKPLIALFDFPIVPAELTTLVNKLFEYIQAGTGILNFFVPFDVIRPAIEKFTIPRAFGLAKEAKKNE